ncbi:MAG: SDR family oxidoreductase [Lentimicrobium sp.]|nr:SDR family oxidoreductase [Lentimicrobium sp.]
MNILLTGATGYIGKRLLPALLADGHKVTCIVRDRKRFQQEIGGQLKIIEADLLNSDSLSIDENDIDVAFYLIHSMGAAIDKFEELETRSVNNFIQAIKGSKVKQIIYLSGLQNPEAASPHLQSRLKVEQLLMNSGLPCTTLRAGIIVGSGSASFEIIRDLSEKLPVMVTPRWLNTLCQPIAVRDVINCLMAAMMNPSALNKILDIGGPEALTYKQMLLQYAEVRGLKRLIFVLPLMTPRLSSYWLYFVTSTSYKLAVNLVNSMKVEVICRENMLESLTGQPPLTYKEAIALAFKSIAQHHVVSSWKDALVSSSALPNLNDYITVPEHGCFHDLRETEIKATQEQVISNVWSVGGEKGWYYANSLWKIRGYMDKMVGGTGLRRGRTNEADINAGDALDFWRVLLADRARGRLLLYAEMKLPGEAWLEFSLTEEKGKTLLKQTATFRPKGLTGRLYWYSVWPLHQLIFRGMNRKMAGW